MTIATHKKGDWWDGIVMTFPFSITGYIFKAQFKQRVGASPIFEFSSIDGTMTINTVLNKLTFVGKIIDQPAFKYISDLEMIPPNGHVKTITDINWEISQDKTR